MNPSPDPDLTPTTNNEIERSRCRILDGILKTVNERGTSGPHRQSDFVPWWPPATSNPLDPSLLPNYPDLDDSIDAWAEFNNLTPVRNTSNTDVAFIAGRLGR